MNYEQLNSNLEYKNLTSGFDLNNALGRYRSAADAVVTTLIHKPDSITNGEITVDWFPADSSNLHGIQIIHHATSGYVMNYYIRACRSGNWGGWNKLIKDTDLYANDFVITKPQIPLIGLNVDENKKAEIYKNASSSIDAGTYINDYTDGVKTSVVIKNNRISVNNNDVITASDYKGAYTLCVFFQVGTGRLYSSGYTSVAPIKSCTINKITITGTEELSAEDTTLVLVHIVDGKTVYFSVPDHMASRFSGKACRIEVVLA